MAKYLDGIGLHYYDTIVTSKLNQKQDKITDIAAIREKASNSITSLSVSGNNLMLTKGDGSNDTIPLPDQTGGKITDEQIDSLFV